MTPENDAHIDNFIDKIIAESVQFGGNSTIGFGYTNITQVMKDGGLSE
jgi:CRISPR/Cas system CMR subunit Cmr4 (Cas7 group RAMP superfamily)